MQLTHVLQMTFDVVRDANENARFRFEMLEDARETLIHAKTKVTGAKLSECMTTCGFENAATDIGALYIQIVTDMADDDFYEVEHTDAPLRTRADLAFEAFVKLETHLHSFKTLWAPIFDSGDMQSLQNRFNIESSARITNWNMGAAQALTYDLNIAAARQTYQNILNGDEYDVAKGVDRIFRHFLQAGLDDEAARLYSVQHKMNDPFSFYTQYLEDGLNYYCFARELKEIARERGQLPAHTTAGQEPLYTPRPNVPDAEGGKIITPVSILRDQAIKKM